jgi:uncharacterized membrane protein YhaH (DUF805 family)
MSKVPLIFQPLIKYADFNGRARRLEFWLWVLFRVGLGAILTSGMMAMLANGLPQLETHPEVFLRNYFIASPIVTLVNLGLLIPTLAVGVRRLHDINRSGWWIVLPYVVAFIGVIAFMIFFGAHIFSLIGASDDNSLGDNDSAYAGGAFLYALGALALFAGLPSLIAWIVMLVFYLTEGTIGTNRFGADPKARSEIPHRVAMRPEDAPEEMY